MEEGLISYIARNLVNEPDKVQVNKRDTRRTTILELSVAPDDMGVSSAKADGLLMQCAIYCVRILMQTQANALSLRLNNHQF
jgi:hypothetical protein